MEYFIHCIAILLITASCGAQFLDPRNIDLYQHIQKFENQRFPLDEYELAWKDARAYIKREFEAYGLLTHSHEFQSEIKNFENGISKIDGVNIIGESQSPKISAPVFLVGTNYDSTLTNHPLKETGASLAVLLETARNFQQKKGTFNQNTTILFVAFDLNVKNYIPSSPGKPGSFFFVQDWLSEYMQGRKFLGALILDSISTVNTQPNSQNIPEGFAESFPQSSERIRDSGNKADFLAVFSRPDEANQFEVQNLLAKFQEVNQDNRYHLEDLTLPDGAKIPDDILQKIQKSPVHDFWKNSSPLPAMLLTDLEKTRTDSAHSTCADDCSLQDYWTDERNSFLRRTTEALLELLLRNQQEGGGRVPEIPGKNSASNLPMASVTLSFFLILQNHLRQFA